MSAVPPDSDTSSPATAAIEDGASVPGLSVTGTEYQWLLLVAYLHLEQRRPEQSRTILRVLHRLQPNDAQVQRCLALAELMSHDGVAAARAATRAMQADDAADFQVPVGLIFARSLWEQGLHDAARDYAANLPQETAPPSESDSESASD